MKKDIYYGYIIKGDLHSAINYVSQFPEHSGLYDRFLALYKQERYITYDLTPQLNDIMLAYQKYYREVFYLCVDAEWAAERLRNRLAVSLDISDKHTDLSELEQHRLVELFRKQGLSFMGGKSSGYYGPYIWRTTETVSYDVELPGGVRSYAVKLLDGFITRSWIDYLSFGEIAPGGWADGDGYINCVKSAWDFDSESFRVSLLKHEAQHARDLEANSDMSSDDLEYRAKLVELIYSTEQNLLQSFFQEADPAYESNSHAMAAYRIVKGFADILGVNELDPSAISTEQIQSIARVLFDASNVDITA